MARRSTGRPSGAGRRSISIPQEVHQIGLDDLASIEDERREISRRAGFGDDTAAYRASLDADVANTPQTKDELVARATEDIERALAASPRFFGVLPKAPCEVRPVEEYKEKDAPFAYYYPPAPDGSRPGHLLRQRIRPAEPQVHEARHDDVP